MSVFSFFFFSHNKVFILFINLIDVFMRSISLFVQGWKIFGVRFKIIQNYFKPSNLNACWHLHLMSPTLALLWLLAIETIFIRGPNDESETDSILKSVCMWQDSLFELTLKRRMHTACDSPTPPYRSTDTDSSCPGTSGQYLHQKHTLSFC